MDLKGYFDLQDLLNEYVGLNSRYFAEKFASCAGQEDEHALIAAGQWIDDLLKAIQ